MPFDVRGWLGDTGLAVCSLAAQGVWIRVLCSMWHSPECGYLLTPAGRVPTEAQECQLIGLGWCVDETQRLMRELAEQAVLVRDSRGAIYSQDMIDAVARRAVKVRAGRAATGSTGERRDRRMQAPPRLRFAILKRDGHACCYCGRRPPEVALNVDHIVPVSAGGSNEETNLVTACFDCNIGKGAQ